MALAPIDVTLNDFDDTSGGVSRSCAPEGPSKDGVSLFVDKEQLDDAAGGESHRGDKDRTLPDFISSPETPTAFFQPSIAAVTAVTTHNIFSMLKVDLQVRSRRRVDV